MDIKLTFYFEKTTITPKLVKIFSPVQKLHFN